MIPWVLIVLGSLAAGVAAKSRLSVVAGPLAAAALGIAVVMSEPPNYDMHGFGYLIGAFFAVLALILWLVGRFIRWVVRR